MWKKVKDINAKMKDELSFLCQNGKIVQVGLSERSKY